MEATKVPISGEWKNNMQYTRTMKYFSNLKREKILIHTTAWMNLDTILGEINQSQKDKYYMIPNSRKQKVAWWLPRAQGKENGYVVSVRGDKKCPGYGW